MPSHRTLTIIGVIAASLSLSACAMPGNGMGMGGSDSSEQSATTNNADSAFVMMMIPHHQQAIEMSDMILGKSGIDAQVLALAEQIKSAQGPEIELMQGWLDDWGFGSMDGMDGMNHGGGDDGMMSDEDMAALEDATGAEASRLFLTQMIEHHEGALAMAEDEIKNGKNPDVIALAQDIVTSQTVEIATMKQLLAAL
ncbi:MAG: DUF305 domain-containing protein [Salinibacterium sp.]|nr:DUF305 domain-containing protein [Salinibacterium sp.]